MKQQDEWEGYSDELRDYEPKENKMRPQQQLYTALAKSDDLIGDLAPFLPEELIDRVIQVRQYNGEILDSFVFNEGGTGRVMQTILIQLVIAVGIVTLGGYVVCALLGVI